MLRIIFRLAVIAGNWTKNQVAFRESGLLISHKYWKL